MTEPVRVSFLDLPADYAARRDAYEAATQGVIATGQFILGGHVQAIEERLAEYVGVDHCVGVANGSDALLLALQALGVGVGDEVVTVPYTFFASVEMILQLGARPVFVDIDPATFCLDPAGLEAAITPATKAIMPVSLYGQLYDVEAVQAVADRHGLPVVEDGAQSFGATRAARRSCGVSTVGITSFFPTKPLGCWGDGGAVFTDDAELARTIRLLRHHGDSARYEHELVGWNSRLDALQAAVLQVKMDHFAQDLAARQAAAAYYQQHLTDVCTVPAVSRGNTSVWAQYTVRVAERDAVAERMRASGVPVAVHYPRPIYHQPSLRALGYGDMSMPATERACAEVLCLPLHPFLVREQQDRVIAAMRAAVAG